MSEPEQDNIERPFAFFLNSGEPPSEESREAWAQVRDEAFPIPVVCGDRLPNWSMGTSLCDGGCHLRIYLLDDANDEQYLIHNVPVFIATASNMVDFEGNLNPTMQWVEIQRRRASLN